MFIFCPRQGHHLHLYHSGYFCLVLSGTSNLGSKVGRVRQSCDGCTRRGKGQQQAKDPQTNQGCPLQGCTINTHVFHVVSVQSQFSTLEIGVQLWNNPWSWSCALHRVHEIVSGVYHRKSKDEVVGCRFQGWLLHWSLTFLGYSVDIPEIYTLH